MTSAERSAAIDAFLERSGWGAASRGPLSGDASFRRYERVHLDGRSAVLMDAPPDKEDVRPFLHVAAFLYDAGSSAPIVFAQDAEEGFVLLEDLGDALYSRFLADHAGQEMALYREAVLVLARLHRAEPPALPAYNTERLLAETTLFSEWFLPTVLEGPALDKARDDFRSVWERSLMTLPDGGVTVLRDYHADNLLWLPDRAGPACVGLLDFQDAVTGHAAYDLVSMLEDARRDVPHALAEAMIETYCDHAGIEDRETFRRAYTLLGAQRNCKIIGIFHRLARRDGKPHYLHYLPRVWGHLRRDLSHPAMDEVKHWFDGISPAVWPRLAA